VARACGWQHGCGHHQKTAGDLKISERTAKFHVCNVLNKLGLENRKRLIIVEQYNSSVRKNGAMSRLVSSCASSGTTLGIHAPPFLAQ
jgi:hypothetical protein